MVRRIRMAEAETQLAALLDEVADGSTPIIIERQGRPSVALVRAESLAERDTGADMPAGRGALALVGAWGDLLTDADVDELVARVYEAREADVARPVALPE